MKYKDFKFRPRARLIKILGEQLISSEVIALVELIKNSYDADATEVYIELKDIENSKNGKIIIKDNGTGMTYEKIKNVWLEPATPDKARPQKKRFSKCFKRKLLGEKGVGRFAVHRLGNKIMLVTRATSDCFKTLEEYESVVEIDWREFTGEKYLDEIPVNLKKRKPQIFKNSSGVYIEITDIFPWKKSTVKNVVRKLKSLETPKILTDNGRKERNVFRISIKSNNPDIQKEINSIRNIDEVLESAFYVLHGTIDQDGILYYHYEFKRPDFKDINRTVKDHVDLKEFNVDFFEELNSIYPEGKDKNGNSIFPGRFQIHFFVWDLESSALKVAGLQRDYREIIKPNAGVKIYRDGFRVWPYGDEDDDWLGLDLQRLNAPKERLISRNQIIGFIKISSDENPLLIDQSNREGLVKNIQFEIFYNFVKASLKHMANLRKQDKLRMDKAKEKREWEDEVIHRISDLRKKLKKNRHYELYEKEVNNIESAYKNRVEDILDRYMQAAALGIAYTIPVHEIRLRFKNIKNIFREIEENPQLTDSLLRELEKLLEDTDNIIGAVDNLMKRKKRRKTPLFRVVKNIVKLKERELKKYDIEYTIKGDTELEAEILENLVGTALLNVVDNAIYWIRVKRQNLREKGKYLKGKIEIILGKDEEGPYIAVKDNGTGIQDPLEMLVEPYYSRKADGTGLGLYIVDSIMKRHNGKLEAYNHENGAVFKLIFPEERREKI